MPRFAANLTLMFSEWEFMDRFAAAADAGFTAVECLFPYAYPPEAIAIQLNRYGLRQALFNMPPGDWDRGERGLAALPDRRPELEAAVTTALRYAKATDCHTLHLMAGHANPADPAASVAYRDAVAWTAERLAEANIVLVLEPINPRDMPGYFLQNFATAEDLIDDLGLPNVKLQFDCYHRQILHGDVTMALRRLLPIIGHVQIASVPSRHEPDDEELEYRFLFSELDRLGYVGFIGCEYRPRKHTLDGLAWFGSFANQAT
jgi:hydroxypyruvate isomerase